MKNKFLLLAGLALWVGSLTFHEPTAQAYSSQAGADPDRTGIGNGADAPFSNEVEVKGVKKSATAGASEALTSGLVVMYDTTANDGYTVTRAVTQSVEGHNMLACVIEDTVATGDTNYHRCITKGFARLQFDGTSQPIVAGRQVCVDAAGKARGCGFNGGAPQEGKYATVNTGIISLRTTSLTGTDLPVIINLR